MILKLSLLHQISGKTLEILEVKGKKQETQNKASFDQAHITFCYSLDDSIYSGIYFTAVGSVKW